MSDEQYEDPWEFLDTENNEGELTIALNRIAQMVKEEGGTYERAALRFGMPGHPHSACFWPMTK